ncbi:MAG: ABC transporter permease subunit [Caldilineaceae bacterium]|nr:ABC transporter permease subunit [Caldilineaceae bacterium]
MNWRAIWAIIEKDLKIVLHSKSVTIPLVAIPLLVTVVLPFAAGMAVRMGNLADQIDIAQLMAMLPVGLAQQLVGLTTEQALLSFLLVYFFAPLYLLLPIMVSNVIAADSFAGERERKTLEALLYTPTSDEELLTAKLLAAWLPGLLVGLISFFLYVCVCNVVAWPVMQQILLPNAMWLVLAFWVAPAAAGLGLGTSVLVSARTNSLQSAYQIGSLIVVPITGLIIGQLSGALYLSRLMVFLIGLGLWLINAGIFWFGQRTFRRSLLVARL